MENSNQSRPGPREVTLKFGDDAGDPAARPRPRASADPRPDARGAGDGGSAVDSSPAGDEGNRETAAEREAREAAEAAAAAEAQLTHDAETPLDFESDGRIECSPLARAAVARFKPSERRPQLAEHWQFADREIHEYGYF